MKDCFAYLKELANECGLRNDLGERILGQYYGRMDCACEKCDGKVNYSKKCAKENSDSQVSPRCAHKNCDSEHCVLALFLSGRLPDEQKEPPAEVPTRQETATAEAGAARELIYPFGFNLSQKAAVEKALKHQLSIIEGPPGTGKTQTILNIIANAVRNGESVAVVSGNNSATANVLEKLEKNDLGFIAAPLGNNENIRKFLEAQNDPPDFSAWNMAEPTKAKLAELFGKLEDKLKNKNNLAVLQQELEKLELERRHFEKYFIGASAALPPLKSFRKLQARQALDLWLLCEDYASRQKSFGLWGRVKNFFRYGLADKNFYTLPIEKMILVCQEFFYIQKCRELRETVYGLTNDLAGFSFDEKMREYTELSMQVFRDYLGDRYQATARKRYTRDDLTKDPASFIKDYPVVLSTTFSLRNNLSGKVIYDYVIIDEASQVDLITGALALSCAKKAVIVGDLKQLPHVVTGVTRQKTDAIFRKYALPECYRYSDHSLLRSVSELFPDLPKTLLREHYRCHPKIIGFCNQKFYDNQLVILTEAQDERKPLMVYQTAPGNHARQRVNRRQIDVALKEILPQLHLETHPSIGIATPYRDQADAMASELEECFAEHGVMVETVDKFQGRERDVIVLSTVDNKITEFADSPNRLNVAVSRAVKQLILLLHGNPETEDSNISDLVQYVRYNNLEVVKSEVHSIFDYLFQCYAEQRKEFLKGKKRVSKYDSENLMYHLICDLLRQERFIKYGVRAHVPLNMILRSFAKLDEVESAYAKNSNTHVDFLIFNKLGRAPVLAVEVDGASFHAEGSRQKERDRMKDDILRKSDLPLIRLRTDESCERERLEKALAAL